MITRIELTNFMSHRHTVIEPAAGLTVLVGPNNVGKSAIIAALQILCHNDNSTYVTRHGEKECSVKVETDDGHAIEWRRKTSPSYIIDGQVFDRLGRSGVPDELCKALRLAKVDAESDADFDVHFGTQKSPIFLLGSSAANAARFFAASSDVSQLLEVQKRHRDKLNDAKKEKGRLEEESKKVNDELDILEPVVEIEERLNNAESSHREILNLTVALAELTQGLCAQQLQSTIVAHCSATSAVFGPLTPPPDLFPVAALAKLLADLDLATHAADLAAAEVTALSKLDPPPQFGDVSSLATLVGRLATSEIHVARGQVESQVLESLALPPQLASVAALQTMLVNLQRSGSEVAKTQRREAALRSVAPPPNMESVSALRQTLDALLEAAVQRENAATVLSHLQVVAAPPAATDPGGLTLLLSQLDQAVRCHQTAANGFANAAAELDTAAAELRTRATGSLCPICGTPRDPDQVVAQALTGVGDHNHA